MSYTQVMFLVQLLPPSSPPVLPASEYCFSRRHTVGLSVGPEIVFGRIRSSQMVAFSSSRESVADSLAVPRTADLLVDCRRMADADTGNFGSNVVLK